MNFDFDTAPNEQGFAQRLVGKHVRLATNPVHLGSGRDDFTREGTVTRVAYTEWAGMWLELDGGWWIAVRHVVAADWRQDEGKET